MQDNNQKQNQPQKPVRRFDWKFLLITMLAIIGITLLIRYLMQPNPKTITFTELVVAINDTENPIDSATMAAQPASGSNNASLYVVTGKFKDGKSFTANITVENYNLLTTGGDIIISINADGTKDVVSIPATSIRLYKLETNIFLSLIINLLPYVIMIGFFIFLFRSQGNGKAFDFGKSTARLSRGKSVTFADVAGCDEEKEELVEIIDFLKNPRKYSEIGARIPKGVLLVGPPGTGKTLLAKAVAGEANVPFFSISGSDFVEMFVGVGASRVRDMFKTAKEHAPCIIFIDEIDAVGRQRGAGMGGGHDEREQTLNQLLVEMDGFTGNLGIIVMAATNRPDVLDPALLRPGRFDRQITISNPDVTGRLAILKVHARNKHIDSSVKLEEIAQRTLNFSGADIERHHRQRRF